MSVCRSAPKELTEKIDLLLMSSFVGTFEAYLGDNLCYSCFGSESPFFMLILRVSLTLRIFYIDSLCFLKLNLMREFELLRLELLLPERYSDFFVEIVANLRLLYF